MIKLSKDDFKWINSDPYDLVITILEQDKKLRDKDKLITELLKRIANLEREVERLEKLKENTIKYCRNSSLTLKSHYFIDVINILEGAKYERY